MTDTYNDTTGSRKKFLIPLVVLLLCAVSLTGAGYAYNASVTANNNSAPVDEYFTIDLYDGTTPITNIITVEVPIDGVVLTTAKTVEKTGNTVTKTIEGSFDKENMDIVLYKGKFAITADNLARNAPSATTKAQVEASAMTAKFIDKTVDNTKTYTVTGGSFGTLTAKFYSDEDCANEVTNYQFAINDVTPSTYYYFKIFASNVAGTVDNPEGKTVATDYAAAVIADIKIEFNFTLTATAVENAAVVTLNANEGTGNGVAAFGQDGVLVDETINIVRDGYHITGFFTAETAGVQVLNADGTVINSVANYTDANGKWIGADTVTLYAQWEVNA